MRTSTGPETARPTRRGPQSRLSSVGERYTPERQAEFLLNNAASARDYAAARREVRRLGLDPDRIPHDRPVR